MGPFAEDAAVVRHLRSPVLQRLQEDVVEERHSRLFVIEQTDKDWLPLRNILVHLLEGACAGAWALEEAAGLADHLLRRVTAQPDPCGVHVHHHKGLLGSCKHLRFRRELARGERLVKVGGARSVGRWRLDRRRARRHRATQAERWRSTWRQRARRPTFVL